jgi:hypothetical protein
VKDIPAFNYIDDLDLTTRDLTVGLVGYQSALRLAYSCSEIDPADFIKLPDFISNAETDGLAQNVWGLLRSRLIALSHPMALGEDVSKNSNIGK